MADAVQRQLLVDTDVLIDFLRGRRAAVDFITRHQESILLPAMVAAELYAGIRDDAELAILDDFLASFRLLPLTAEIARTGGLWQRDFAKSHGVGLADCIIAATAQSAGAELITLNTRHYPMFNNLKPPYRKK